MPPFVFSSKANTLEALSVHEDFNIPPLFAFTVQEWKADRASVSQAIAGRFPAQKVAVRSSCLREDSCSSSGAGQFLSLLNIDTSPEQELCEAVDSVIASYGEAAPEDQVLVQPMINDVVVSGVIMTRVLSDGAPYYVINYDDESGKTDSVTGGSRVSKTVYVYRGAQARDFDSPRLLSFVDLAKKLEEICGSDSLDIEFCLDKNGALHLLQTRPICAGHLWGGNVEEVPGFINHVASFVNERTGAAQGLFGQRSILGVMPDWNPAEMIGILPRPLASSLYRALITSRVWRTARKRMGYREVAATELMALIMGRPYIDVRASFNSFLPAGIDSATGEALVSAWLERLDANPQFHDKVEFEIAQTAYDFTFDGNLENRYPGLLTSERKNEFRNLLRNLTQNCLDLSCGGTLRSALETVAELRIRQAGRPLPGPNTPYPLHTANELLEECRKFGTLPFSILARHGFIAEGLLRSAQARGAIAPERLKEFKLSFQTISGELSGEFQEVCEGRRDPASFLRKYGHLRPGSYDILSPRYFDRDNLFTTDAASPRLRQITFALSPKEKADITVLIAESGLNTTPQALLDYAVKAIQGRELAKFIFSRNLSDALEIIAAWGGELGFERDDISYMDIAAILDQHVSLQPESPKSWFSAHVARNRELFSKAQALKLGYLIRSARDIYIAPQHRAAPNFIGSSAITAPVVALSADSACATDISGKIVCIENADPGFDWIFTRGIGGLITEFGGANSHMAIRCAEYGLPAAIGVGAQFYNEISQSPMASIDPAAAILKAQ